MTLLVSTGRMGIRDPDYLDVTLQGNMRRADQGERGGHRGVGIVFAPSPELLYPFLSKRRHGGLTELDWDDYRLRYRAEMRAGYKHHRSAWELVLSWDRVVLLCFCSDPIRCHRFLLADYFVALGARPGPEIES